MKKNRQNIKKRIFEVEKAMSKFSKIEKIKETEVGELKFLTFETLRSCFFLTMNIYSDYIVITKKIYFSLTT